MQTGTLSAPSDSGSMLATHFRLGELHHNRAVPSLLLLLPGRIFASFAAARYRKNRRRPAFPTFAEGDEDNGDDLQFSPSPTLGEKTEGPPCEVRCGLWLSLADLRASLAEKLRGADGAGQADRCSEHSIGHSMNMKLHQKPDCGG